MIKETITSKIDELEKSNHQLKDIIDSIPIGLVIFEVQGFKATTIAVNNMLIQFANQIHTFVDSTPTNWTADSLAKAFENDIFAFSYAEDKPLVKEMLENAYANSYGQCTFRLKGSEGENLKWIRSMCISKKINDRVSRLYVLFQDQTQQVLYEKELVDKQKSLEHISKFDSLTGVHNRYYYNIYIEETKKTMLRNVGIVFADVNGLKSINDKYGHILGDNVIQDFGTILKRHFNPEHIFRISGDEFVIIMPGIDVNAFEEITEHLLTDCAKNDIASIGYLWQTTILDIRQEVYKAEQLMFIQKQNYYTKNKEQTSKHRPRILNTLMDDIENHRYVVYLQPKAYINSTKVIGAEALIRKYNENNEIMAPYEFVPALEKEMLISKIDFFVLEETCKIIKRWESEGKRLIRISVNMSRVSIAENDFMQHILNICDQYNVDHQYIEFEITESAETKDDRSFAKNIAAMYDAGFSVSLDDMGSDYSSINLLPMKGIKIVKLDRSFILRMEDRQGYILIKHIIAMCHDLDRKCIAEGVENKEQQIALQEMGCDYYQGYLLDRPIPVNEFEKYL